jgi:hypothetical protein
MEVGVGVALRLGKKRRAFAWVLVSKGGVKRKTTFENSSSTTVVVVPRPVLMGEVVLRTVAGE